MHANFSTLAPNKPKWQLGHAATSLTAYKMAWVHVGPHKEHPCALLSDDEIHQNGPTESPCDTGVSNFLQSQYATNNSIHQAEIADVCIADTGAEY